MLELRVMTVAPDLIARAMDELDLKSADEVITEFRDSPAMSLADAQEVVREAQAVKARAGDFLAGKLKVTAEEKSAAPSDRETSAKIACSAELFRADGQAHATIEVGGHAEHVPVRSRRFKAWLALRFEAEKGKAPATDALSVGQTMAEARAELHGPERDVFTRVGQADGRLYVDIGDAAHRAVEVDAEGWKIIDRPPVRFVRPADGLVELPAPARGGSLEALRPFVNAGTDDDWKMMQAWLVGALAPQGPYALLALYGEQGSVKSTTSRRLRQVIDPAKTLTREMAKSTHDLAIAAKGSRVLAFDNLSGLNAEMSDALCRLATGGGLGRRRLYTDDEEATFYASRPVILNGIGQVAVRGDLLDRAIILQLPTLAHRRGERELDAEWADAHPAILGALLDAVSTALGRWDEVGELADAPRMADFARWVEAAAPALGWAQGDFTRAYAENREASVGVELEASTFATAVVDFITAQGAWKGTAGDLLAKLNADDDRPHAREEGWPKDATRAGNKLRAIAPAMRACGFTVEPPAGRNRTGRTWAIRAAGEPSAGLSV